MTNDKDNFEETAVERFESERLLSFASRPELPTGAMDRLVGKILPDRKADPAKPSPLRLQRRQRLLPPIAALPLAASLLLGIYLGAMGSLDELLPSAITGDPASAEDDFDDLGGVGEAEVYAEEDQS